MSISAGVAGAMQAGRARMARMYSAPYMCCSAANSSAATKSAVPISCESLIQRNHLRPHLGSSLVADGVDVAVDLRAQVTQPIAIDHHTPTRLALECIFKMIWGDNASMLLS